MTKDPLNMAEAQELVDEEVRAIFAENPKAKKSDKLLPFDRSLSRGQETKSCRALLNSGRHSLGD
jgi:hypothetical protein